MTNVPCGFCYDGRDTEPITLHTGAVKYLCRVCLGDLAHNGINPDDRSRASAMIQPPAVVAECWTCAHHHTACAVTNDLDHGSAGRCSGFLLRNGLMHNRHPLPLYNDGAAHSALGHDVRPAKGA